MICLNNNFGNKIFSFFKPPRRWRVKSPKFEFRKFELPNFDCAAAAAGPVAATADANPAAAAAAEKQKSRKAEKHNESDTPRSIDFTPSELLLLANLLCRRYRRYRRCLSRLSRLCSRAN